MEKFRVQTEHFSPKGGKIRVQTQILPEKREKLGFGEKYKNNAGRNMESQVRAAEQSAEMAKFDHQEATQGGWASAWRKSGGRGPVQG